MIGIGIPRSQRRIGICVPFLFCCSLGPTPQLAMERASQLFVPRGARREIALDAGPLAAGRAVEHYEMSRYGALKAWATQLGMKDAAALLDQTAQEEKKTDALLSKLAQATVEKMAA